MTRTNERPFDKALKEACKAYKELEKLQSESKLTADSFFKEALEAANIKESDLKPIAEALNSGKFPHCSAFVRSAEKWVREQTCKRPPRELRRLTWLGRGGRCLGRVRKTENRLFRPLCLGDADDHQKESRVLRRHRGLGFSSQKDREGQAAVG